MATKIRLQRHGKKGKAFFHIVAADSRAPRDGRFIEKLGVYNPHTDPATIDLDFDRTLNWLQVGAEMTDTARAILSYKGILYKNHLINGVAKGALTEAQVEEKFSKWVEEKEGKVTSKRENLTKAAAKAKVDKMKAEVEVSAARAKEIEAKNTPVEAAPEVEVSEETPAVEATEEGTTTEETPETEAVVEVAPEAEVVEAPVAQDSPVVPEEEVPEIIAEVEETPAVEAEASEETPAAEATSSEDGETKAE